MTEIKEFKVGDVVFVFDFNKGKVVKTMVEEIKINRSGTTLGLIGPTVCLYYNSNSIYRTPKELVDTLFLDANNIVDLVNGPMPA